MDALRELTARPLTAHDLANIADFRLGDAIVSPSRRKVSGPGGTVDLQPRIMQVLVVLAQSAGRVVSRETLFERCWGSVYVGDDSLNRAIAEARKIAAAIAASSFDVETVPKTGYSLIGAVASPVDSSADRASTRVTRRRFAGVAAGLIATASIGAWATARRRQEQRFEQLLALGDAALAGDDTEFKPNLALQSFQAAVAIHPNSAPALGRLALAQAYFALYGPRSEAATTFASAEATARKALAINPTESHALQAEYELQGSTLDWFTRDRRLRQIVAVDPSNGGAIFDLSSLLQASGMIRESWTWNEHLLRAPPLSQNCVVRRALELWIFGRIADADNVLNQLRAQFPTSQWVWFARLMLYALTDRAPAAQAMIVSDPALLRPGPETLMWRSSLEALVRRSADATARAREACEAAARASATLAGPAMMIMCALTEVGSAFDIANGSLLSRGALVPTAKGPYGPAPADAAARIDTRWLFMPPCRDLRADVRFAALCEGVGLAEYWRRRGVQPDYLEKP